METLQLLGTALGLGALAGINLYLTVFVAGLAIQQQWIALAPQYADLQVLGHPTIVAVAGVLYCLQFFADKVPWVDSLWDLVHSVIRPVGGAFLAIKTLGSVNPAFDVTVALLAGGVALSTHGLKAGARLVANASPEPFSNIALSVTEDVAVVGGLLLLQTHPILALIAVVLLVAAIFYLGPKIARAVRVKLWLAWRKLNTPAGAAHLVPDLPKILPSDADILLHSIKPPGSATIKWAAKCIAAGSRRVKANASGYLVALEQEQGRLHFVGKGWFRTTAQTLELEGYKTAHESKFLSENLVLYSVDRRPKEVFFFERAQRHLVARLAEDLRGSLDLASRHSKKEEPPQEPSAAPAGA